MLVAIIKAKVDVVQYKDDQSNGIESINDSSIVALLHVVQMAIVPIHVPADEIHLGHTIDNDLHMKASASIICYRYHPYLPQRVPLIRPNLLAVCTAYTSIWDPLR